MLLSSVETFSGGEKTPLAAWAHLNVVTPAPDTFGQNAVGTGDGCRSQSAMSGEVATHEPGRHFAAAHRGALFSLTG
jgi:hypothetical protein